MDREIQQQLTFGTATAFTGHSPNPFHRQVTKWTLLFVLVGAMFALGAGHTSLGGLGRGAATGLFIGFPAILFEAAWGDCMFRSWQRRTNFSSSIILKSVVWLISIAFGLSAARFTFGDYEAMGDFVGEDFWLTLAYAGAVSVAVNFVVVVNQMLGRRALLNLVTGKYQRPKEEARIFLLVDIEASSRIAERIGDRRFHAFLSEVVADMTPPIMRAQGEIYKYLGDGVIVTWLLGDGATNSRAITCFLEILQVLDKRRSVYEREFGALPVVRASLHAGPVVTGEMGLSKKELVFVGDTLNTCAKIEQVGKKSGERLLISGDMVDQVVIPDGLRLVAKGRTELPGKDNRIELYTLRAAAA